MLLRKRAWDIMRDDPVLIEDTQNLGTAIRLMREEVRNQPDSQVACVVNENGRFLGAVTIWDLIRNVENLVLKDETLTRADETDWDKAFSRACSICYGLDLKKIMHKKIPMVKPNDPLVLVVNRLVETKRSWAVVEEGGRPIGVVFISDLFREISREMIKLTD
jgi:CBS domain-containing protein